MACMYLIKLLPKNESSDLHLSNRLRKKMLDHQAMFFPLEHAEEMCIIIKNKVSPTLTALHKTHT